MHERGQKELPLWPLPRWPNAAYMREAFELYLVAAFLVGFLFFVTVVTVARPSWAAIFAAGVMAGGLGLRWCRRAFRRLGRLIGGFPRHA